jgi:hypothetical protein
VSESRHFSVPALGNRRARHCILNYTFGPRLCQARRYSSFVLCPLSARLLITLFLRRVTATLSATRLVNRYRRPLSSTGKDMMSGHENGRPAFAQGLWQGTRERRTISSKGDPHPSSIPVPSPRPARGLHSGVRGVVIPRLPPAFLLANGPSDA